MESLIVLGLIPGTHMEITFLLWQLGIVGGAALYVSRVIRQRHLLRTGIILAALLLLTRQRLRGLA